MLGRNAVFDRCNELHVIGAHRVAWNQVACLAVQLAEDDDGHVEFLGQALDAAGDVGDFLDSLLGDADEDLLPSAAAPIVVSASAGALAVDIGDDSDAFLDSLLGDVGDDLVPQHMETNELKEAVTLADEKVSSVSKMDSFERGDRVTALDVLRETSTVLSLRSMGWVAG